MPVDKGLFFYGGIYHKLLDPHQAEAREVIAGFIPEGSSVLDIGCGTGQLCFALREKKQCRVVGIDLSIRMLRFAEKSNPYNEVTFVHQDATDLSGFGDCTFDFATVLILMHELPREKQLCVLSEALRVAHKAIIVDASVPLPKNPSDSVCDLWKQRSDETTTVTSGTSWLPGASWASCTTRVCQLP